jgi:hypothetical protein
MTAENERHAEDAVVLGAINRLFVREMNFFVKLYSGYYCLTLKRK